LKKRKYFTPKTTVFKVSKTRIILGVAIGLFYAVIFYSLLYVFREGLRFVNVFGDFDIWVLSDKEVNTYNLLFAYLSIIIATSIAFQFVIDRPKRLFTKKNYLQKSIIIEQRLTSWCFLNTFGKIAFFIIILYGSGFKKGVYLLHLDSVYNYFFILVILVLFLQMWNSIRFVFKQNSLKWMLFSFIAMSIMAFALSKFNLIDYHKINKVYFDSDPYAKYDLQLPESDIYNKIGYDNKFFIDKIYLVKDKHQDKAIIVFENKVIPLKELANALVQTNNCRREEEKSLATFKFLIDKNIQMTTYQLFIDKDIQMATVNRLKSEIAKTGISRIVYAVLPKNRKYDPRYYKHYTINKKLQSAANDSTATDLNKKLNAYANKIVIEQSNSGDTYINDTLIDNAKIKQKLNELITKNKDYVVKYYINDNINYADYLKINAYIIDIIAKLRNEYAQTAYQKFYKSLERDERKIVKAKIPLNIFEICSSAEKYFPRKKKE
jgi:biopolymer transport protein ExbD